MNQPTVRRHWEVLTILIVWFLAALALARSGLLARTTVPPPLFAIALTAIALLVIRVAPGVREELRDWDPIAIAVVHILRLPVGALLLYFYEQGHLPAAFAITAGWGDMFVGLTGLIVVLRCMPVKNSMERTILFTWNAIGLLDIVLVLANAARLFVADRAFAGFFDGPLGVLPLFFVPLVLVSHVLIFAWTPAPVDDLSRIGAR